MKSKYILFLDECGDHSLTKINPEFPYFVLAAILIERTTYEEQIIPAMSRLKLRYWDHEGINLHSRDIRKSSGPFSFLQIRELRESFLSEMSLMMSSCDYLIFSAAVNKTDHLRKWGDTAENPYILALRSLMLDTVLFLKSKSEFQLPLVAEARGKREDNELEQAFYKLSADHKEIDLSLVFQRKENNIAGIQLADLAAHPIARTVINPQQENRAYREIESKIVGNRIRVFP